METSVRLISLLIASTVIAAVPPGTGLSTPPSQPPSSAPSPPASAAPAGAAASAPRRSVPPARPAAGPARPAGAAPTRRPTSTPTQTPASRRTGAPTDVTGKPLAPEQVDSLIEVAEDLSPEWAEWLRARRVSDPDALRGAIQNHGRRLIALAVLREQSPDLYELKVSELRLQSEVGDAAKRYREAVEAGRTEEADALLKSLREKTAQQVDKSLKTRAAELAALDQQVKQLKERLLEDSQNRDDRIKDLLKSLTSPSSGEPFLPPPGDALPATPEQTTPSKPEQKPGLKPEQKPAASPVPPAR